MTTRDPLHGVTRRGVLKTAGALGAAAFAAPFGGRSARAEPVRGGTLRIGMGHGSTTDSLDPATWENAYTQIFANARHNYLTEIAADGTLEGAVAESWEASPDAITWTFRIRDGVAFHSGRSVTAADVVASINHHRGTESKSAAKPIVDQIEEIRADGSSAVVVRLKAGNADFPFVLSDYHLPVMPAVGDGIDVTSTDGCGAYAVESFEHGIGARLTRFDGYWKGSARGHVDAVELLSIIDAAARQNALVTGLVDVIDRVDLKTVHLLQRSAGIRVLSVTGTQHYGFPMDSRAAPFSDTDVRLALKHGVDRQQMLDTILNGYGSVANDHPIGPSNRFFNTDLAQRAYDPERAKHHLKKAGMDSLTVDIHLAEAAFGGAVDAGVLMSESMAAAGITLNVVREPNDGYWSHVWMKKPFVGTYWGGRPTEDWMFSTAYSSGAAWNETFWDHPRFNELLLAARSELDEARRREMYFEMQQIVSDEGAIIIPMYASYVMAVSDRVQTPEQIGANWTLDGHRATERWWLA